MPERTAKMSEWLMALCFEPRGLALCELRHARFPLSISLWRNAFNSRAGNFELLGPTAKIFQFVIRAAREVSGFAPLRNGFIHESRRSETVANNGDFGETKADFRYVPLGHEKSHVLPPGTRPRRRWIRFMRLCYHSARGSTVEARGCVIASGSRGWRVGRLKIPQR